MLGNLFKSADTKIALQELEKELGGKHGNAWRFVAPKVRALLMKDRGVAIRVNRERGMSHNLVIYFAAKICLEDILPTGDYHTYRGVLSFRGQMLFGLYVSCVQKLGAFAEWDEDDIQRELTTMKEDIAKAG